MFEKLLVYSCPWEWLLLGDFVRGSFTQKNVKEKREPVVSCVHGDNGARTCHGRSHCALDFEKCLELWKFLTILESRSVLHAGCGPENGSKEVSKLSSIHRLCKDTGASAEVFDTSRSPQSVGRFQQDETKYCGILSDGHAPFP